MGTVASGRKIIPKDEPLARSASERERAGERESGREGERESGRAGERESGRAGEDRAPGLLFWKVPEGGVVVVWIKLFG